MGIEIAIIVAGAMCALGSICNAAIMRSVLLRIEHDREPYTRKHLALAERDFEAAVRKQAIALSRTSAN